MGGISHIVHSITHPIGRLVSHIPVVGKPVMQVAHAVGDVGTGVAHTVEKLPTIAGGLVKTLTGSRQQPQTIIQAPAESATPVEAAAAPNIAVPTEAGSEEQTSAKKRKTVSSGKRSLTVARASGSGVNV